MVFDDLSQQYKPGPKQQLRTAPVSDRFIAFILDVLIFSPIFAFVLAPIFKNLQMSYYRSPDSAEVVGLIVSLVGFILVMTILIQTLSLFYLQTTPGKFFLKIKVVNTHDPSQKISFTQSLIRSSLWVGSILLGGLPMLEVISHRHRKAIYDRAAELAVVTLKEDGDPGPHFLESRMARQFTLAVTFFAFFWTITVVSKLYHNSLKGNFKRNELIEENMLCKGISEAPSRIENAVSLYLAEEITQECLEADVDFELWKTDSETKIWAYFGKSLYIEDKVAYENKVCEISEAHFLCQFVKNGTELPQDRAIGAVMTLKNLPEDAVVATKAFALLDEYSGFESFVSRERLHLLHRNSPPNEVENAYKVVSNLWTKRERIDSATQLCMESRLTSCTNTSLNYCTDMKEAAFEEQTPETQWATLLDEHCQGQKDFAEFTGVLLESMDLRDLAEAAFTGNVGQKKLKLYGLFSDAKRSTFVKNQAFLQWLRYADKEEEIQKAREVVKSSKNLGTLKVVANQILNIKIGQNADRMPASLKKKGD